jgi:cyclic pyranopterin phosphate synthase
MTAASPPFDSYGRRLRDLRISVTDRCNFRCPYCMPAEIFGERYQFLPKPRILTFEEIESLSRIFVGLGTGKLRITGGEPLVRAELPRLIERLAAIEGVKDLAMTTNASLLAPLAQELKDAGLGRVTVSVDSLDDEVFQQMNGKRFPLNKVLAGLSAAERVGLTPIKINCVVQRGVNDHLLLDLARRFRGPNHILRLIEFMDVGTLNGWKFEQVVPASEILERIDAEMPLEPTEPSYRGEVARRYSYRDGGGEIGIIASVTQPFCGDCTRARLSADGHLVTCLFAKDGTDLKTPLRAGASDEELRKLITRVWRQRDDRYSDERFIDSPAKQEPSKIEMYQIGG